MSNVDKYRQIKTAGRRLSYEAKLDGYRLSRRKVGLGGLVLRINVMGE